jgi:hypothetical protein
MSRPSSSTAIWWGCPCWRLSREANGEDGTIFGLPDSATHLEIVRVREPAGPVNWFDQLVFYLADEPSQQDVMARLAAHGLQPALQQHPYWQANGGITYYDPDGRGVIFASWIYGRDIQPASRPG